MKIGEILLRKKLLSSQQLSTLLTEQQSGSRKLGELLLERGIVSETDLVAVLQEQKWRREGFWMIE
ncbi:MAG TPA: hypothetical protein IGS17_17120 [Oscillatoriales cyanobacterium M59_W2019_021]|nr:MAG: hypothetical protein D6728_20270 [Cyanobacteria bacterium J055]HIK30926.1 hypothetical protein [Oscillatoriales cyanobacterium M4454_W2019_049]HIK52628.1 hypothetical protein [Oscillatoriales cyanobacterium M59_W2019_021]